MFLLFENKRTVSIRPGSQKKLKKSNFFFDPFWSKHVNNRTVHVKEKCGKWVEDNPQNNRKRSDPYRSVANFPEWTQAFTRPSLWKLWHAQKEWDQDVAGHTLSFRKPFMFAFMQRRNHFSKSFLQTKKLESWENINLLLNRNQLKHIRFPERPVQKIFRTSRKGRKTFSKAFFKALMQNAFLKLYFVTLLCHLLLFFNVLQIQLRLSHSP